MSAKSPSSCRIATLLCLHDDHWFLPNVLQSIPECIDRFAFVSTQPWNSSVGDFECCAKIAEANGATVVQGDWADETSHRREAMEHLRRLGYTHALVVDADEVFEPKLLDSIIKLAEADLADRVRCFMDTYWSDVEHVVRPREQLAPIVLIKLDAVHHHHIRDFQGGRELVLSPEYGVLHHLSYAGPDERIKRKIETWSHRDELIQDWWRRSWLGWKADPTLQALHPTHPQAYGFIERIDRPEILKHVPGGSDFEDAKKPKKWPTVSVVIPIYEGEDDLRQCLDSLAKIQDLLHQVIVVDDASPDQAAATLAESYKFVDLFRSDANQGFSATCNLGAEKATGEVVLFLNSDTIVPRSGLLSLVETLTSSGSIGAAGPMTNNAGYYQRITPTYTDLSRLDLFAADLAHSRREDRDVDMLVGFCLAVRRSVLDEVGLFDTRFGRGMFEDTDLCYRIARAGYRLRLAAKAYVHHWGSRTIARAIPDVSALLNGNEKVYREKWVRDIETGFASHLPGLAINEMVVQFDAPRAPEKIEAEIAALVKEADISLCMIVRNEERVLGDCLTSAKSYFNQIIVIDTGSTDRTIEIAKEHGAEVHEIPWPDSFAAARNESMKYASGKWIFWMDADDTLPRHTGESLVGAALNAPKEIVGLIVPVRFMEDGQAGNTQVDHVKLFRNISGLTWEGRIHEQILPALREHGGEIGRIDAVVLHSGYDTSEAGQAKKRERDWYLLNLDLAERPDHPFVLFNVGMTHHYCAEHEQAIEWLERCIQHSQPHLSHVRKAYEMLGTSQYQLGRTADALATYAAGNLQVGDDPELAFRRAKLLAELGRLQDARRTYEQMPTDTTGFYSSLDIGILTFKRLHNLGSICLELGDYVSARDAWRKAIAANPKFEASALSLFDAALDNGDLKVAREALNSLYLATGPDEAWALRGEKLEFAFNGDEGAELFLRDASARHPRAVGPAICLARRLCRTGRELEAAPMLRGLSEVGNAEAAFYLGVSETRLGHYEEAVSHMRRARDLNSSNVKTQEEVARLEAAIGPGVPPTEERKALLYGPHRGKLGAGTRRCSVVVVTYNSASSLPTCLQSVLPTLSARDEVIVVDNHSSDNSFALAKFILKDAPEGVTVKVIKQKENIGYAKSANLGILACKGEKIVLLNPDTEVYPDWIEKLGTCLVTGYAAVGPLSDRVSGDQFVKFYLAPGQTPTLEQLNDVVSANPGRYAETRCLMGFCLMTSRGVFDLCGLLEEGTALGADDLEFSWRLRGLGYRICVAADTFVRHEAGVSFTSLPSEEKTKRVHASDACLVEKLKAFYSPGQVPSSEHLFGTNIFAEALRRDEVEEG